MVKVNQQDLENLVPKFMQEKSRIEDGLTLIKVYMVRGDYELAIECCGDTVQSLKELINLQKQSMHQKANELNAKGFNVKVVKRSV